MEHIYIYKGQRFFVVPLLLLLHTASAVAIVHLGNNGYYKSIWSVFFSEPQLFLIIACNASLRC